MALMEYLLFRFSKGVIAVVDAPQGDNREEVEAAQRKLEMVQKDLQVMQTMLEQQRQAEESLKRAEAELKAAVADLKAQEDAYRSKIEALERKSTDPNSPIVQKSKAANELAQLKSEDPLPLRKAKITQEAALRKVEKQVFTHRFYILTFTA